MKNRIKILLVDDSPTQRLEFQSILENAGYLVVSAHDGINALDHLKNTSELPDAILSDIFMPNMNGFELCRKVKEIYPNIPCVILNAQQDEENLQKALDVGALDFIEKPFTKIKILLRIANILKISKRQDQLTDRILQSELVMEGANIGWWDWDIPTGIEKYNEILPKLLGYKSNEIEPNIKWWETKIHPDDIEGVNRDLQDHFEGKTEFFINTHRLETKNGKWKWFFDHGKVISRDKTGKPIRMIGTLRDIDLHYRTEMELKQKVSELDQIFNSATDWMRVIDLDYNVLRVNDSFAKILAKDKIDLIGKKCYKILPGSQCNTPECPVQKMIIDEKSFETNTEKQCHDGVHSCSLSVTPFTRSDGVIIGIVESFRDITKYKKAEKEIIKKNKLLNNFINQSPYATWISDEKGTLQYANPALKKFLNLTDKQLVGKYNVLNDEIVIRKGLLPLVRTVFEKGETISFTAEWDGNDMPNMDFNGSNSVIAECKMFPLFNSEGKLTNVVNNWIDITERQKVEDDLVSEKLLTEDYINSLPGLFYVFDDKNFIRWNKQWEIVTGYSADELKTMYGTDFFEGADKILLKKQMKKVFTSGNASAEAELITKQGKRLYYYFSGLRKQLNGKFYLIGLGMDISKRKKLENTIIQEKEYTDNLISTMADGLWVLDVKGRTIDINRGMTKMLGYRSRAELMKKSPADITPEKDLKVLGNLIKCSMSGKSIRGEHNLIRKDGTEISVSVHATPRKNIDKKIIGVLAIIRDITEDKKNQEELTIKNEAIDSSINAIAFADLEGNLTYVNKAFLKIWMYKSEKEVIGKKAIDEVFWDDVEQVENVVTAINNTGGWLGKLQAKKQDGTLFPVQLSANMIYNKSGKAVHMMASFLDITEEHRIKEALTKRVLALTRPIGETTGIHFVDLFNLEEIQQLQDHFAQATGVASIITRPDGIPITKPSNFCRLCKDIIRQTEIGCMNCQNSDRILGIPNPTGPVIQPCMSGGLWDAGTSIMIGGKHIATWLVGQVRNKALKEEKILPYADVIGVDKEEFRKAYREVTIMTEDQFKKVAQTLFTLANQLSKIAYQNIQQARFIEERKNAEEELKKVNLKLKQLAFTDSLTGLINRKPFIDLLEKNISKHQRTKQKMALIFMDIDGFKEINDIFGHDTGDKALVMFSEIFTKCIRESDIIGRFGGDEFVLCLENIQSITDAVQVAQKINKAFSEKITIGSKKIDVGVSIGIAVYPNDSRNTTDLIKNSDLAMYKSKKLQKNSYHVYDMSLDKELFFNLSLREAFNKKEFELNYQVIVDKNMLPHSAEALLRWESPKYGTVMPTDFIPTLNRDRSILEIGEWVFSEACKKLKNWNNIHQHMNISVNISPLQFEDELIVDKIENIIKETKVNPKNIMLEITEKDEIKKTEKVSENLKKLKAIGIGFIVLDDFGVGYSSFSNLLRYSIDIVKIDKFFIDRLKSKKYTGITASLIALIKKI